MLVHVLLANQTVISTSKSMVRREENICVILLPALFQSVEDATNLLVHMRNDRVVLLAIYSYRILATGKRSQFLVS